MPLRRAGEVPPARSIAAASIPGAAPADDPEAVFAALQSPATPAQRARLLTGLIQAGDPAPLARLLRVEDAAVRTGALGALRIMAQSALPLLPALLTDADPDVRVLATEIALGLPGETATEVLIPVLLHDPHQNVCAAAVEVLAEAGTQAAVPALQALAARFPANDFLAFAAAAAVERLSARA
jgi:HEAT repeat protein